MSDLTNAYGLEHHQTIKEYLTFLEKNEFGFWTDTPELFPNLPLDQKHYAEISNAIVDTSKDSNHDYNSIFQQLDALGCEHLQLRFFDTTSFEKLLEILPGLDGSGILSVDLLTKNNPEMVNHHYRRLLHLFPRITQWIIHSSPVNKTINDSDPCFELVPLVYLTQVVDSESHCGAIHPGYFTINVQSFTEGRQFNSCLNKKISVDQYGMIKNCPSMKNSYGKAGVTDFAEALKKTKFKEKWTIHKDQISVCKACEFRYICIDCRAYTDGGGTFDKPLKCNYNPYTAQWE